MDFIEHFTIEFSYLSQHEEKARGEMPGAPHLRSYKEAKRRIRILGLVLEMNDSVFIGWDRQLSQLAENTKKKNFKY